MTLMIESDLKPANEVDPDLHIVGASKERQGSPLISHHKLLASANWLNPLFILS